MITCVVSLSANRDATQGIEEVQSAQVFQGFRARLLHDLQHSVEFQAKHIQSTNVRKEDSED